MVVEVRVRSVQETWTHTRKTRTKKQNAKHAPHSTHHTGRRLRTLWEDRLTRLGFRLKNPPKTAYSTEFFVQRDVDWCRGNRVQQLDRYFSVCFLMLYGERMCRSVYAEYKYIVLIVYRSTLSGLPRGNLTIPATAIA